MLTTLSFVENASTAVGGKHCSVSTLRHMVSPVSRNGCLDHSNLWLKSKTVDGGFAEYCAYPAGKVFKIHNLSDVDATLLEPASCACHGLEKIAPKLGSTVLMFGAGPTGLCLAQLLRHNGGSRVVIAAPEGLKMDLAKNLDAADEYISLSRSNPEAQFQQIKEANPYGFDIVVEVPARSLISGVNFVLMFSQGYWITQNPRRRHSLRPPRR